ncbi:Protease HtpX homolog [hydrothermal vent metagenome]|uniref:Protease HtpX homolog n=1 Tax=hydrothermal vent metagenome TaxID=652676 RepID=A0A3B0TAT6_9ZZZZ
MANAIRTLYLLATLTLLFMLIGLTVAGWDGMIIALVFSLVTNLFAYWNSDRLVLYMQNAVPLRATQAPEIYDMVEILSRRAGIPMPKIYLIEAIQPNAFATGRSPRHAVLAISSGLIAHLTRDELAAVIAHELAHIRSRDTMVMAMSATLAGAVSMLAQFGLFFGGRSSTSPLGPVGALIAIIVSPIAAIMVQLAVSRTREYEADRDGAHISGDPLALASALKKISRLNKSFENPWVRQKQTMAHLFIINPLSSRGTDRLFSTHPNVENRVAELERMAAQMQQKPALFERRHVSHSLRGMPQRQKYSRRSGLWRPPSAGAKNAHRRGPWG